MFTEAKPGELLIQEYWRIFAFNTNGCVYAVVLWKQYCDIIEQSPIFKVKLLFALLRFYRAVSYLLLKGFDGPSRAKKLLKSGDPEQVMHGRYNKCTRLYYCCLVYCGGADCVLFRYTILRKKGREWCYLNVSIITPFSRVNFKLRLKVSTFLLLGSHYVFCNTCLYLWYLHSYSMVGQFVGILRSSLSCITRPRPQTIHCTKSFCIPHLEW